jgi:DNA-binding Lrp family transcriptional regulator
MSQPVLKPQDVVVLLKLISYGGRRPSMAAMAMELSISPSEVHGALKRLIDSRLVSAASQGHRPLLPAVEEFLVHGLKYAFPAKRGVVTRGVVTSHAADPLRRYFAPISLPPVWPHPEGTQQGVSLEPLYRSVPAAALRDPALHEMLALVDALRDGRARERKLAEKELVERIRRHLHEGPEWPTVRSSS